MGVVNVLSPLVTAKDGGTIVSGKAAGGVLRSSRSVITPTVGDSVGSTYRLIPVRSGDVLQSLKLWSGALGAGVTANVGLYRRAKHGGAVVKVDLFATLIDMATAKDGLEILYEQAGLTGFGKALWEIIPTPPTADPMVGYDLTVTIAGAAIGTASPVGLDAVIADA